MQTHEGNTKQKMIYYAAVAKNKYVIADYTAFDGDFRINFQQLLNSSLQDGFTKSMKQGEHSYYVRHHKDGNAFGCMASALVGSDKPNQFLDELQTKIYEYFEEEDENSRSTRTKDLTLIIQQLIDRKPDTPNPYHEIEMDIGTIQDSVKSSMLQMMEKDQKLSDIEDKSRDLKNWSQKIEFSARRYRKAVITSKGLWVVGIVVMCILCYLGVNYYRCRGFLHC